LLSAALFFRRKRLSSQTSYDFATGAGMLRLLIAVIMPMRRKTQWPLEAA
jgi:hypothetical protein